MSNTIYESACWPKDKFVVWYDRVRRANHNRRLGPVPRGFKRVIFLQNMAGPMIQRVPGLVTDIPNGQARALKRSITEGLPVCVDCPRIKGKFTSRDVWQITEAIHDYLFKRNKYSSFAAFEASIYRK